jgi:hypothetical protein
MEFLLELSSIIGGVGNILDAMRELNEVVGDPNSISLSLFAIIIPSSSWIYLSFLFSLFLNFVYFISCRFISFSSLFSQKNEKRRKLVSPLS